LNGVVSVVDEVDVVGLVGLVWFGLVCLFVDLFTDIVAILNSFVLDIMGAIIGKCIVCTAVRLSFYII
jgi:hypothetical protein